MSDLIAVISHRQEVDLKSHGRVISKMTPFQPKPKISPEKCLL